MTFNELRQANLMHPHAAADHLLHKPMAMLGQLDDTQLAQALAEMIIQIDWLAANRDIDLVLAIRNRFATGDLPGGLPHGMERKRPGA